MVIDFRVRPPLKGFEKLSILGPQKGFELFPFNYEDTEGTRVDLSAADRTKDPFIYNGGTITNRLTGTIPVEATKTWEIAAFQDSLKDVTVEFTLQQRLANPAISLSG